MIRILYQNEINRLRDQVLQLGSMVEHAITGSVEALKQRDHAAAERIIKADRQINAKRYKIENDVLTLIATQQPMASDMRTLAAILEITTELERLGDYAKGIVHISIKIGDELLIKKLIDIPIMAEKAVDMLRRALEAFSSNNVELALSIPADDQQVDDLYEQIYRELIIFIMADASVINQANDLLWVAHNLERTADRVNNLCERVVYMVTGDIIEITNDGITRFPMENKSE
ncbi:MAG: phosphate signaling complex protein PhoU [Anaerolineales bacterium]|nr:phosphate signaling complex protein PhoU [Anaerolineales bacterium]